uniref:Uncharacterized protein n=1 Tax=Rhizophora mucronata TaxID=61149 RepID=A0A2P2IYI9_RHIMU
MDVGDTNDMIKVSDISEKQRKSWNTLNPNCLNTKTCGKIFSRDFH